MINESNSQLIELPDRKEITLCEAVTAFVYGKARDSKQLCRDREKDDSEKISGFEQTSPTDRTGTQQDTAEPIDTPLSRKVKALLERLHGAAYAGRVKFRAIHEGGYPEDGYKDIDPLYFYIKPIFNWPEDVIYAENGSSTPWYFVHLDQEQFVSLLRDMGISVQQGPNPQSPDPDVPEKQKIYKTGVAGRPTSKHLVLKIAQSHLDAGDCPEKLSTFAEQLAAELTATEPDAAPMTAKTISNALREWWRTHQKRPK